MPISVHVRGERAAEDPYISQVVESVFAQLRKVDMLFSTYRADSEISRLNRAELTIRDCDPLVREVVELCEQARERTDGYFDARLPHGPSGQWFDPSGLVKGWAVERASVLLAEIDDHDYYVNAGGDMALAVRSSQSPAWQVGIEDPRDRTRMLAVRGVRSGGVATSGTAARGQHLINPRTGHPANDLLAVTVIGPELLWADVFATAAFGRGSDALSWLSSHAREYEALVVDQEGRLSSTRP